MGFKFQFITLAASTAELLDVRLAHGLRRNQMSAYVELQEREFRRRGACYHARSTSVRLAQATSTGSPTPWTPPARPPLAVRPKEASSTSHQPAEQT